MSNSNSCKCSLSKATWKHKGRQRVGYGGKQGLWELYVTRHSVWLLKVIMDRKKKAKRQSTRVCCSPPTKSGERSTHLTFRITLYLVKYKYAYIYAGTKSVHMWISILQLITGKEWQNLISQRWNRSQVKGFRI